MSQQQPNNLLASMKRASQRFAGVVADTGAKTMLKTDVVFLERDINARKHAFGIEVYDLLKSGSGMPEVQKAFEACQSDIAHLEAKVDAKKGEMQAIDGSGSAGGGGVEDAETPGIPSTP